MKHFKKWKFWVLFAIVVFAGSLFFINFDLLNQYPEIPNVCAQNYGEIYPSDIMFSYDGISQGVMYGVSPHNVIFAPTTAAGSGHPSNIIFQAISFPGDFMFDGSNGKTEMRTIMTCVGSNITKVTCDWNCGPTFSFCSTANVCDGGNTIKTCSSNLFGGCGGPATTFMTCTSGIFCDGGPNLTYTTCSSSIFCGGPTPTSTTCTFFCDGGPIPTFITCSGSIFCDRSSITVQTCVGRCPTENPPVFPAGYGPNWSPEGMPVPDSIIKFSNFSLSLPSMPYSPGSMAGL